MLYNPTRMRVRDFRCVKRLMCINSLKLNILQT